MEKVATIEISREDDGELKVNTEFHGKQSVADALLTIGSAARGMIDTGVKLAAGYGLGEEESLKAMGLD